MRAAFVLRRIPGRAVMVVGFVLMISRGRRAVMIIILTAIGAVPMPVPIGRRHEIAPADHDRALIPWADIAVIAIDFGVAVACLGSDLTPTQNQGRDRQHQPEQNTGNVRFHGCSLG
jgi:hypothetical protein